MVETVSLRYVFRRWLKEESDMARNQVSVDPRSDGRWAVQSYGAERADSVHDRKEDAVKRARELAANKGAELVIKDERGKII